MLACPECHLLNPDGAKICDCGFNFETRQIESAAAASPSPKPSNLTSFLLGGAAQVAVILLLLGLAQKGLWVGDGSTTLDNALHWQFAMLIGSSLLVGRRGVVAVVWAFCGGIVVGCAGVALEIVWSFLT
jgi:hypothetical protein